MSATRRQKRAIARLNHKSMKVAEGQVKLYLASLLAIYAEWLDQNAATMNQEAHENYLKVLDLKWIDYINKLDYIDKNKGSAVFRQEAEFLYRKGISEQAVKPA